jgi:hypothetical protein
MGTQITIGEFQQITQKSEISLLVGIERHQ